MEWIHAIQSAIKFMEQHITEDISAEDVANHVHISSFHFQRGFRMLCGYSIMEYIRNRRLALAGGDLAATDMKIIDVAGKYGYSSPTAFNRAFQSVHGIAPSAVKSEGIPVKSFPPVTFKITVKGVEEMNYRIETKEAFRIVGVSVPLYKEIEKNFTIIPPKWQEITENGTLQKLIGMMDTPPMGVLGVSTCNDAEEWKYYIAVSTSQMQEGLEEYMVPAATWAIFSGQGTNQSIQELEQRIVTEWLPTSGYEYGSAPDVEVYLNPDPQNAQYEVWIPVTKKE